MADLNLETIFLAVLLAIGIYLIFLAGKTPMLGEDEAVYTSLAKDFSSLNYPAFRTLGTPDSPFVVPIFMPLIFSSVFLIFGASLSLAKVLVAFFGFLTLILVYLIGKRYNIYYGFFSALLLVSIISFDHQSMLAYVETPIAFFSVLISYLLLDFKVDAKNVKLKSIAIGAVTALAFYTKFSALIFIAVFLAFFFGLYYYTKNKSYIRYFFITTFSFVAFISAFIIRNLVLYSYPFFEGLNAFFKYPSSTPSWLIAAAKQLSPASLSISTYSSTFGWLPLILSIFGLSWLIVHWKTNKSDLKFLTTLFLPILIFITIFNIFLITGYTTVETRYLSIIFPQVALIGGFFLWKLKEQKKSFILFIAIILLIGLYSGISIAQATSNSQRYPNDYIQALTWLKSNTPKDSLIFTAYGGSLLQFADRRNIWTVDEFPDIMRSQNGTYIYNTLKKYNVSYIFIWNGILAQDYIVPQSNLLGAFTYNFLNVVSQDIDHFNQTFSNQNNIIYKLT